MGCDVAIFVTAVTSRSVSSAAGTVTGMAAWVPAESDVLVWPRIGPLQLRTCAPSARTHQTTKSAAKAVTVVRPQAQKTCMVIVRRAEK